MTALRKPFLLVVLFCAMVSCKKSDPMPSRTQLLIQNTWQFSSGKSTEPITQSLLSIYNGAEFQFKIDKTYNLTFLTVPSDGIWEFSTDEAQLTLDKGTRFEVTYIIVTLDGNHLDLKQVTGAIETTFRFVKK